MEPDRTDRDPAADELVPPDDADVEELDEAASKRNPDETTRREALELDLEDRGRSDEGEAVGDET
jgi:hypothetical protein